MKEGVKLGTVWLKYTVTVANTEEGSEGGLSLFSGHSDIWSFIYDKFRWRPDPDLGFFFFLSVFCLAQNQSVMDSSGCEVLLVWLSH